MKMKTAIHPGPARTARLGVFLLAVMSFLLPALAGCSGSEQKAPAASDSAWDLTIFHTNDMHGAFLPEPASWRDDKAEVGGMVALAWQLAEQRKSAPVSLLLDAGDFMTGNPIRDIEVDGVRGAGFVAMMNAVGYDVGVIGNHEFDLGRDNARRLTEVADFPMLAADILDEQGRDLFAREPEILERGSLKVGVMGVSCASLFSVTAASRTAGLSLRDQAQVVRELIAELDPKTDLLVLISHNGIQGDQRLARELSGSGLDVIVGGHSHTRLNQPEVVGDILIVQAGSHMKNLGRLDLRVDDDRVTAFEGRLIQLVAEGTQAEPELTRLVNEYKGRIDELYGQVIGTLATDWDRRGGESNIGNWISDRIRERAAAEVAFINSSTLRKDLPAGPIRILDIHEVLPFENTLVTFDLTGEQILTILRQNAQAAVGERYGILQVSGLRYGYRLVGDHVEVEDVAIGGQPLERSKIYKAAAPDYVVLKAERYFNLPVPEMQETGVTLTKAIVEAVEATEGPIKAEVDGRQRRLAGE